MLILLFFARLYNIENSIATAVGAYPVGRQPTGFVPGSKVPLLGLLGETAVDFDFGPPELNTEKHVDSKQTQTGLIEESVELSAVALSNLSVVTRDSMPVVKNLSISASAVENKLIPTVFSPPKPLQGDSKRSKKNLLMWPIYILRGDGSVYVLTIFLYDKVKPQLRGPLLMRPSSVDDYEDNSCSLVCLNTTPSILCICRNNGSICHSVVLPCDEDDGSSGDVSNLY